MAQRYAKFRKLGHFSEFDFTQGSWQERRPFRLPKVRISQLAKHTWVAHHTQQLCETVAGRATWPAALNQGQSCWCFQVKVAFPASLSSLPAAQALCSKPSHAALRESQQTLFNRPVWLSLAGPVSRQRASGRHAVHFALKTLLVLITHA